MSSLRMLLNSVALVASTASTLVLGFVAWLVTARIFPPEIVGIASSVIAAMMLCVQIALLGVGSAIIVTLPQYPGRASTVLNSAVHLAMGTAVVAASGFLLLSSSLFSELTVVGDDLSYTSLFIIMSIAGTLGLLFDQASVAVHRSDQVLVRGITSGVARLVLIASLPFVIGSSSSEVILLAWVIGSLGAVVLGVIHLARGSLQYRFRFDVDREVLERLLHVGLRHHVLTLADRAPGLLLPIVATEVLSPSFGAYWYSVWMMAFITFMIPTSIGMTLFAEAADEQESLSRGVGLSLRISLILGAAAAVVIALLAYPLLSILGHEYASHGVTPLRILVASVFPLTLIQVFYAICRATDRVREAILVGMISGIIGVGAAAVTGVAYGLIGMAFAWLTVQTITAVWALYRIRFGFRDLG